MNYKFSLIWSDLFIYLLALTVAISFIKIMLNKYKRQVFIKLINTPMRLVSVMLLICFFIIAILDSVHIQRELLGSVDGTIDYSNTVESFLDILMQPVSNMHEKTYSAPFADTAFVPEIIMIDGKANWVYPKLNHVKPIKIKNIYGTVLHKSLYGFGIIMLMFYVLLKIFNLNHVKIQEFPVVTFIIFVAVLNIVGFGLFELKNYYHILGTNKVGGDVFYAAIKSVRTGLIIGLLTTLVTMPFAVLFGTFAGYKGGIIDDIIQYIYTTLSSVPSVLLIAAAVLSMQVYIDKYQSIIGSLAMRDDIRLLVLCVILGLTSWTSLCRLLRAETLKLREQGYVESARMLGVGQLQIILKHIIPNLTHIILIAIALDFSSLVLAEAVLSYVGVGVSPSTFSWGNMINSARMDMAREPVVWWSLAGSFVMMFMLVISANIFADSVRDALDPKLRQEHN